MIPLASMAITVTHVAGWQLALGLVLPTLLMLTGILQLLRKKAPDGPGSGIRRRVGFIVLCVGLVWLVRLVPGALANVATIDLDSAGQWTLRSHLRLALADVPAGARRSLSYRCESRPGKLTVTGVRLVGDIALEGGKRYSFSDLGPVAPDLLEQLRYTSEPVLHLTCSAKDQEELPAVRSKTPGHLVEGEELRVPVHQYDDPGRAEVRRFLKNRSREWQTTGP